MGALARINLPERASQLMGGKQTIGRVVTTDMAAHDVLSEGLPTKALRHFVEHLVVIGFSPEMERALGLSYRTYLRGKEHKTQLNTEQSGRAWKFAEIVARVTDLLGSQKAAELWLEKPAIGLNGRRPIELMSTPSGIAVLEALIGRLEYGVYT